MPTRPASPHHGTTQPYDASVAIDPVGKQKPAPYDRSASKSQVHRTARRKTSRTLRGVVTLRRHCGYSATIYDLNPVESPKPLRRHFGEKYDVKKVRNKQALEVHRSGELHGVSVEEHLAALIGLAERKKLRALREALRQRYPERA